MPPEKDFQQALLDYWRRFWKEMLDPEEPELDGLEEEEYEEPSR